MRHAQLHAAAYMCSLEGPTISPFYKLIENTRPDLIENILGQKIFAAAGPSQVSCQVLETTDVVAGQKPQILLFSHRLCQPDEERWTVCAGPGINQSEHSTNQNTQPIRTHLVSGQCGQFV